MLNLIKMNLYRLMKSKTYIAILVFFVFTFLLGWLIINMNVYFQAASGSGSITVGMENSDAGALTISGIYCMVSSILIAYAVAIFSIIHCEKERKHGFIKNLSAGKKDKARVFLAKIVPAFVVAVAFHIAMFAGTALGLSTRGPIPMGDSIVRIVQFSMINILLCTGIAAFSMAAYELFRNVIPVLILVVNTISGAVGKLIWFGELCLFKFGLHSETSLEKFDITRHFMSTRISGLNIANMFDAKPSNIVIALVGMTVYLAIGVLIYQKKDVV